MLQWTQQLDLSSISRYLYQLMRCFLSSSALILQSICRCHPSAHGTRQLLQLHNYRSFQIIDSSLAFHCFVWSMILAKSPQCLAFSLRNLGTFLQKFVVRPSLFVRYLATLLSSFRLVKLPLTLCFYQHILWIQFQLFLIGVPIAHPTCCIFLTVFGHVSHTFCYAQLSVISFPDIPQLQVDPFLAITSSSSHPALQRTCLGDLCLHFKLSEHSFVFQPSTKLEFWAMFILKVHWLFQRQQPSWHAWFHYHRGLEGLVSRPFPYNH